MPATLATVHPLNARPLRAAPERDVLTPTAAAPVDLPAELLSTLINLAGRQRMLSQRLPLLALQAALGDTGALAQARSTLDTFADSHQQLVVSEGQRPGLFSPALQQVYGSGPGEAGVDAAVRRYIQLAETTLNHLAQSKQRDPATLAGEVQALVQAAGPLLSLLNLATQAFEHEARERSRAMQTRITDLITDIQTVAKEARIVAFNAQVAARRAGEAGREFSVVATRLTTITEHMDELTRQALRRARD